MLAVESIAAAYGRVHAVRDVSLHVAAGEVVALFGANGAGKTSLLRAITGSLPVATGRVLLDKIDITGWAPERIARAGVAHIPQGRGVFAGLNVWQNLKMGGYVERLGGRALDERVGDALARFPVLGERLSQRAGTLSGGEQQMLAIARALIGRPRLLLIDEPSHGLGPRVVREVFGMLERLRDDGIALLLVEQYAEAALRIADRGIVLERGRVVRESDADALRADRDAFAGAYLGTRR